MAIYFACGLVRIHEQLSFIFQELSELHKFNNTPKKIRQ